MLVAILDSRISRRSCFILAGTYRIGCFGDSFTEGFETASGHDYPSFLQEQLQATAGRKLEVINFAMEALRNAAGLPDVRVPWQALPSRFGDLHAI